jgi:hypothetical protein
LVTGDRFRGGAPPELGNLGLQGSKQPRLGSGRTSSSWVNHLGVLLGSAGLPTARATAWAARVSRARRRARVPVPRVAYDPRRLVLKVRGKDAVLTKARDRLERGGVVTSTRTGGGGDRGSWEERLPRVSGLLVTVDRRVEVLRRCHGG